MERPSSDEQPASQWQKMSAIKDGVELFPLISQNFLRIFFFEISKFSSRKRYMAKWTCYFPRPWHGNKCLRICNGKQLEAYCECGKAVRGAKVDSDCGWVGIVSFFSKFEIIERSTFTHWYSSMTFPNNLKMSAGVFQT